MANERQKEKTPRLAGKPRVPRAFARHIRDKKAEIRRVVANPDEQRHQIAELFTGMEYQKSGDIEGTSTKQKDA